VAAEQVVKWPDVTFVATLPKQALRDSEKIEQTLGVLISIDDTYPDDPVFEEAWRLFWAATNLFQFLPICAFISNNGLANGDYDFLWQNPSAGGGGSTAEDTERAEEWDEAMDFSSYPALMTALRERLSGAVTAPEVGLDWTDASGSVLGTLEWVWTDLKIAAHDLEPNVLEGFNIEGWQVFDLRQLNIEQLTLMLMEASGDG
jgi:hypothetical protein